MQAYDSYRRTGGVSTPTPTKTTTDSPTPTRMLSDSPMSSPTPTRMASDSPVDFGNPTRTTSDSPVSAVAEFGGGGGDFGASKGNKPPDTGGHPVANSSGSSGFGFTPDLSGNPELAAQLDSFLSSHTYSFPAGGWLSNADAQNANSYYNKFGSGGGGDPTANQLARTIYGAVGDAPTVAIGSPALNQLYASTGQHGKQGPSYNSRLNDFFDSANPAIAKMAHDAGFRGQYEGPWALRGKDPNYNQWGVYNPPGNN